jgi:hypothetical protein
MYAAAKDDCVQAMTGRRQNDVATARLRPSEDAQVDVTNGTSLSVDDAAGGSSVHQVAYLDTERFGYC